MTLKLVSNVEELGVYNFQDIADCARRFADQLEAGEQGDPFRVVIVTQSDIGLGIGVWGENGTPHELAGLLQHAAIIAITDDAISDE